jgi:hypothetical protein
VKDRQRALIPINCFVMGINYAKKEKEQEDTDFYEDNT